MAKYCSSLLCRRLMPAFTCSVRNAYRHPELFPSLAERIAALNVVDPEVSALVDIGLPDDSKRQGRGRTAKLDPTEKQKLMDAAITRTLKMDLEKQRLDWERKDLLTAIHQAATHYGIFTHLYHHGHFVPRVVLHIAYPHNETLANPVHRGNILLASEASAVPDVSFTSGPEEWWTLILTSLDGHLNDPEAEYVHWFISNIKGGDLSTGEELAPYLQPFPPRGTGYHRMAFVLYKQDQGRIQYEFPKRIKHRFSLKERTFKTFDFYKAHQDLITPAGLNFFQAVWDPTLTSFFHNSLEMKEPVFEYDRPPKTLAPQEKYPDYESFNRYLDRYRDPKELRQEVLLKRLKMIDPFKEEPPMSKYPNLHVDPSLPTWILPTVWKENNRLGRFRDLRPHSVYEQPEFDFHKDMYGKKAGQDTKS